MFENFSESLRKAKQFNGTAYEKFNLFFEIYTWQVGKKKDRNRKGIIKSNFLKFDFLSFNYWTIDYLFEEIFLQEEYYFQPSTQSPVILDCGANVGMSVLYFKWKYPDSRIVAFEPNPNSFDLLKKNIVDNRLKDVEIHNLGLFDQETSIPFYIDNNLSTLMGSIIPERGGNNKLEVHAKKLSQFIKKFGKVDLVKMDVEGAEENILNDLVESGCLGDVKEYIIEYHLNLGSSNSKLSSFLARFETHGYNYNIRANFKRTRSFQDVLIHFYKYNLSNC